MRNPFESPYQQTVDESGQNREPSEPAFVPFNEQERAIFDRIDEVEATGDVMRDFAAYDAATNHGMMGQPKDEYVARRILVGVREELREGRDQREREGDAFEEVRSIKALEALDRILEAAGETAESQEEFDDREAREEGAPYQVIRNGLESYAPSGDIKRDALVFLAITRNDRIARRLGRGEDPVTLLRDLSLANAMDIESGILPEHMGDSRYWVTEIAPIENAVIEKILLAASNG